MSRSLTMNTSLNFIWIRRDRMYFSWNTYRRWLFNPTWTFDKTDCSKRIKYHFRQVSGWFICLYPGNGRSFWFSIAIRKYPKRNGKIDLLAFVPIEESDPIQCPATELSELRFQVNEILRNLIGDIHMETRNWQNYIRTSEPNKR